MMSSENYLDSITKQFQYYKHLGDKTFVQLEEQELFWQYNEDSNSIAIIVNHLWGNMRSRWTDFLTSDGEKEWRKRDEEFEDIIQSREDCIKKWEAGWSCLFEALATINEDNFNSLVYIRNQGHTLTEAIHRQLAHYAYRVGQMVYIGKMIQGENWESLSIPKGASKKYNTEKFSQKKSKQHVTDEFLTKKDTESN